MREQKLIASRGTGVSFVVHVLARPSSFELCSSLLRWIVLWRGFRLSLWTIGRFLPLLPQRELCPVPWAELVRVQQENIRTTNL